MNHLNNEFKGKGNLRKKRRLRLQHTINHMNDSIIGHNITFGDSGAAEPNPSADRLMR